MIRRTHLTPLYLLLTLSLSACPRTTTHAQPQAPVVPAAQATGDQAPGDQTAGEQTPADQTQRAQAATQDAARTAQAQIVGETPRDAVPAAPESRPAPAPEKPAPETPRPEKPATVQPRSTPAAAPTPAAPTRVTSPARSIPDPADQESATPAPAPAQAAPTPAVPTTPRRAGRQLRGMWVDAFGPGFKTPGQVDQLIRDARALNLNALFVQAYKRGDCYCSDGGLPRTEDPEVPAGFDPLRDVISKAHAAGLQVHAWIIPTAVANRAIRYSVSDPDHVVNAHGVGSADDWIMRSASGASWAGNDQLIDLGNPSAVSHMLGAIQTLADHYALDGVQLDRIRYPDPTATVPDWGYNPGALDAYREKTGAEGTPDPSDPAFTAWRRGRVTAFVEAAHAAVKSVRPHAWLSVAAITYGAGPRDLAAFARTRTYQDVLQDWPAWLADGQVDLVVMMNYKRDFKADQAAWFDQWNAFGARVRGSGRVAVGTALYLNPERDNHKQIARVVGAGLDGWVGYSYRSPAAGVDEGTLDGDVARRALTEDLTGDGALFAGHAEWPQR